MILIDLVAGVDPISWLLVRRSTVAEARKDGCELRRGHFSIAKFGDGVYLC